MAVLELREITKSYDGRTKAVDGLDLTIEDGEFIILVGPSGCGKSTVLRMLAGLEEISSGEFLMDGVVMNSIQPQKRELAMVFQSYALYPHLTVYENMAFPLILRKMAKDAIDKQVRQTAEILTLTGLLQRMPRELSGGQRQRVALGRAMVRKPKAFLFDEPLSNLDAKLRAEMRIEIAQLHARLKTNFVYVTHDQVEAMTLGQRIVVLKDGRLQQFATPAELFDAPANMFVAGFIGTPAMNFLTTEIQSNDDDYWLTAQNFQIRLSPSYRPFLNKFGKSRVVMGIRARDLYLKPSNRAERIDPAHQIQGKLILKEMLGEEVLYYLDISTGSQEVETMVVKETVSIEVDRSSPIQCYVDPERIYLFDPDSGQSLLEARG